MQPSLRLAVKQLLQETVGNLVGNRIMPGARAQSSGVPAITYTVLSTIPQRDLDGFTGVAEARVEVSVWSFDFQEADAILEWIRRGFMPFSGTIAGIRIDTILVDDSAPEYEDRDDGSDQGLFEVVMQFLINHQPA